MRLKGEYWEFNFNSTYKVNTCHYSPCIIVPKVCRRLNTGHSTRSFNFIYICMFISLCYILLCVIAMYRATSTLSPPPLCTTSWTHHMSLSRSTIRLHNMCSQCCNLITLSTPLLSTTTTTTTTTRRRPFD